MAKKLNFAYEKLFVAWISFHNTILSTTTTKTPTNIKKMKHFLHVSNNFTNDMYTSPQTFPTSVVIHVSFYNQISNNKELWPNDIEIQ